MVKKLKFYVFGLLTLLVMSYSVAAQQGAKSHTFTIAGADSAINLKNTAIAWHQLTWNVSGTSSVCTAALDTSTDGTTWSAGGAISGQTCTSNGSSSVVNVNANYVRINMTALTVTAGSSVTVTWDGWVSNPGGGGGGGNISGTIAAPQVAYGTGTDTIGGSNQFIYDPTSGILTEIGPGAPANSAVTQTVDSGGGLTLTDTISGNPLGVLAITAQGGGLVWYNGSTLRGIGAPAFTSGYPNDITIFPATGSGAGGRVLFSGLGGYPNSNALIWDLATGSLSIGGPFYLRGTSGSFALDANDTAGTPAVLCPPTADPTSTGYVLAATLTASGCDGGAGTQLYYASPSSGGPEYSNGTCTTSATIDGPAYGNMQSITLTEGDACALTFTQPSFGTFPISLTIYQSTSSPYNGTISTTGGGVVEWPGGTTPTITVGTGVTGALATNDVIVCHLNGTMTKCVPSQDFQ